MLEGAVVALGLCKTPGVESTAVERVKATFEGFEGDRHSGLTATAGVRAPRDVRGAQVRNTRQISIVSAEELAAIAAALGLPSLDHRWLGANVLVEGIAALSLLPPSTRLCFGGGAILVVDAENLPCIKAGKVVAAQSGRPELGPRFAAAAAEKRGVVAWVEREGEVRVGDRVEARFPKQRPHPAW